MLGRVSPDLGIYQGILNALLAIGGKIVDHF
jgi:hypothetical protein